MIKEGGLTQDTFFFKKHCPGRRRLPQRTSKKDLGSLVERKEAGRNGKPDLPGGEPSAPINGICALVNQPLRGTPEKVITSRSEGDTTYRDSFKSPRKAVGK